MKFPVPVFIPRSTAPRLKFLFILAQELNLDPVVFNESQMLEQPPKSQRRGWQSTVQISASQVPGLEEECRSLIIQKLLKIRAFIST